MLRIATIHNLPPGGARRVAFEHARLMDAEVLEFCLGTATPVTEGARVVPFTPRAPRVSPALRPALRYTDFAGLLRAWQRLATLVTAAEVDVVMAHPCRFLQAPPALRRLTVPTVYFCHEPRRVDYEAAGRLSRNPRTRHLYGPLHAAERTADRDGVRHAGAVVTNSRFTASRIQGAYGRDAAPLPLGVPAAFRHADDPAPPRHLLSVGALIPSKGHDLVIEAAARTARRWPVVVVAPRPDPGEEARLRGVAAAHGVELSIRVAISDDELVACFHTAVATLYLAREEPFGLVSLEAQACGCPVIVSAEGGLPETLVEGVTGWAVPREAAAAAARVDALDDAELRAGMAARAAEHGQRHTWEASAAAALDVLAQAAGR